MPFAVKESSKHGAPTFCIPADVYQALSALSSPTGTQQIPSKRSTQKGSLLSVTHSYRVKADSSCRAVGDLWDAEEELHSSRSAGVSLQPPRQDLPAHWVTVKESISSCSVSRSPLSQTLMGVRDLFFSPLPPHLLLRHN